MKIKLRNNACFNADFIRCDELYKETQKFINSRVTDINKLQYLQCSNLSDEEFYKTVLEVYEINFSQNDLLQISSENLKKEVTKKL